MTIINPTTQNPYNRCTTTFNRDASTLRAACRHTIFHNIHDGTNILDYASSNGKEAVSILAHLGSDFAREKIKIHGYDLRGDKVEIANKGVFFVSGDDEEEDYLIDDEKFGDDPKYLKREFKQNFNKLTEETEKPDYELMDADESAGVNEASAIKYFKIKDQYRDKLKFERGDINDIEAVLPGEPVGAVFFCNAFYHLLGNYITPQTHEEFIKHNDFSVNKQETADKIVDKIHRRLDKGGILVLGSAAADNFVLADKFTPLDNISNAYLLAFGDKKYRVCKKSPIHKALEGRFVPIHTSGGVDTVWKKVK
jgi:hypothetical protein